MTKVLEEKNQVILWTEVNLFFEWKIEISDSETLIFSKIIYSSYFKLSGKKEPQFSFFWNTLANTAELYLFYDANLRLRTARIVISDSNKSVICDDVASTEDLYRHRTLDGIRVGVNNICSKSFPLTIIGIIYNSNNIQQSQSTEKNTNADEPCSTDSTLMTSLSELSVDFKKLLGSQNYSDIVLKVEDVSIKAHKNVLHARSPVFQKMLSHDTTEAAENTIVVADISAPVVQKLVAYLYTGEKEKCSFEECCELYYAADKYEVLSLREACRVELLTHLQVDNACTLLGMANRHSDERFSKEVMQFINDNYKSVVETKSFEELSKEDLQQLMRSHAHMIK